MSEFDVTYSTGKIKSGFWIGSTVQCTKVSSKSNTNVGKEWWWYPIAGRQTLSLISVSSW